jgi:8-oxo-dGTP pyrophosphatase MutT (NUDIX family)
MKRDVAIVALVSEKGEIFLVRTHSYPDKWQPLGGGVDDEDEDPRAAGIREVREEAGIELAYEDVKEIMQIPFDFGEGTVYCFTTKVKPGEKLQIDQDEIAEGRWFYLSETKELPAYPATKAFLQELQEKE